MFVMGVRTLVGRCPRPPEAIFVPPSSRRLCSIVLYRKGRRRIFCSSSTVGAGSRSSLVHGALSLCLGSMCLSFEISQCSSEASRLQWTRFGYLSLWIIISVYDRGGDDPDAGVPGCVRARYVKSDDAQRLGAQYFYIRLGEEFWATAHKRVSSSSIPSKLLGSWCKAARPACGQEMPY